MLTVLLCIWDKVFKNGASKICGSRPYPFKFFKGCLPQILVGPMTKAEKLEIILRIVMFIASRNIEGRS